MKCAVIFQHNPRARAVPGWHGGPAIYAQQILSLVFVGSHARFVMAADNDNGVVAA